MPQPQFANPCETVVPQQKLPPSGVPLREILRRRRRLSTPEATRLLQDLPALLDAAPAPREALTNAVFVCCESGAALTDAPIAEWPAFRLQLASQEETENATVYPGAETSLDAPARLAMLIYELLGGRRREAANGSALAPLAALGERENAVLSEASRAGAFARCEDFWAAWLAVSEEAPPKRLEWRIPRWAVSAPPEAGDALDLSSCDNRHIPLRFVARREFRIGRSRSMSDLPVRLTGEDGEVDSCLSRVQAIGERTPDGPALRDGDGERPSANGTLLNGERLSVERARLLSEPSILCLGDAIELGAMPVKAIGAPDVIANLDEWAGAAARCDADANDGLSSRGQGDAVYFEWPLGIAKTREAVWISTAIGFALSPTRQLIWGNGENGFARAWILHCGGCFWLANAAFPLGELRVDEAALDAGQIVPLSSGQLLQVGALYFLTALSEGAAS